MISQAGETIQKLMDLGQDLAQATTLDGIFMYTNASWRAALGYSPAELVQQSFFDLLSVESQQVYGQACQRAQGVGTVPVAMTLIQKWGQPVNLKGHLHWQAAVDGEEPVIWWIGQVDLRAAQPMASSYSGFDAWESEARFRAIFEQAGVGINQVDLATGQFLLVNQRFCEIVGYSEAELLQMTYRDITHPDDLELNATDMQRLVNGELASASVEKRYIHKDASLRWVKLTISILRDSQGHPRMDLGIVEDICDRKQTEVALAQQQQTLETMITDRTADLEREIQDRIAIEQQLFQEKELAQVTLHSIGDGVITTDAQGRVQYLNPVAEKLTGWHGESAQNRWLSAVFQVVNETTRTPLANPVEQVVRDASIITLEDHSLLLARNGHEYGIDCTAAPIHDRDRQIIGVVIVFRDVTQSRRLAQKVSWQATHDAMTGLVNRHQFEHDVDHALQEIQQRCSTHVLCYLDLDRFKIVNDLCGHQAGDELLRQIAAKIKRQVRASDIVARLGGDEFGILLKDCSLPQAQLIADALRSCIYSFQFVWEGKTFKVGMSIGLVPLDDVGHSFADVINAADAACYAAKDQGRNRIQVYQLSEVDLTQQQSARQWCLKLREALVHNQFCLYQQPITSTTLGSSLQHQEILVRLLDGQGQAILPGAFIPAAERYRLMAEIDQWVIQTLLSHHQDNPRPLNARQQIRLSMLNLASGSIYDDSFCQWLIGELARVPALARQLCFEISETTASQDLHQVSQFVQSLKQLGCRVALDNFGSGVSCFKFLQVLPIDYLKIDGRLVQDIAENPATYAIVEAINHVAHTIGVETIAETVSTPNLQKRLRQIGVDYMQGYGVARPQPLIAGVTCLLV
jgi:diguanylate cyclase (GGDEF)-like protein/PAS domain S-box-containing protein